MKHISEHLYDSMNNDIIHQRLELDNFTTIDESIVDDIKLLYGKYIGEPFSEANTKIKGQLDKLSDVIANDVVEAIKTEIRNNTPQENIEKIVDTITYVMTTNKIQLAIDAALYSCYIAYKLTKVESREDIKLSEWLNSPEFKSKKESIINALVKMFKKDIIKKI